MGYISRAGAGARHSFDPPRPMIKKIIAKSYTTSATKNIYNLQFLIQIDEKINFDQLLPLCNIIKQLAGLDCFSLLIFIPLKTRQLPFYAKPLWLFPKGICAQATIFVYQEVRQFSNL